MDLIEKVHITKILMIQDLNLQARFTGKRLEDINLQGKTKPLFIDFHDYHMGADWPKQHNILEVCDATTRWTNFITALHIRIHIHAFKVLTRIWSPQLIEA